jgi:hypothetical protein
VGTVTTPGREPAKRLAELLETLPADERTEITAWLLGQRQAAASASFGRAWPHLTEQLGRFSAALPSGEDSQLVTIRLPAERHAQLRAWCAAHEFTMASVVRGLIERFLEQQQRGSAGQTA